MFFQVTVNAQAAGLESSSAAKPLYIYFNLFEDAILTITTRTWTEIFVTVRHSRILLLSKNDITLYHV